ncbi:RICIN domain-containing protein [Spiractinospora alimapuensis]|uniref:RICIN domain-containing protein n=1 Tax=Spiractinospora alimapuensis TaxID=2820884 RepID=UPI001F263F00|nr:RICIN domain-containing protein [Spiractinospora alimapuensis]QVQ53580.1 RICIN domain-containing protein [Spiractinospora alimapuensis]
MPRLTPRPAWLPPLWVTAVVVALLVLVTAGSYLAGTQWGSSHAAESRDQAAPPSPPDDTDEPDDEDDSEDDDEEPEDEEPEELPAGIDPEVFYVLRNTEVDRAMDVSGVSTDNNAHLVLWDTHGEPNQQFRFEPIDDGTVEVAARHSGKVLQVGGQSGADNADLVTQLTSTGDANQRWTVEEVSDGVIRLTNDATGRPLVATGTENGDSLVQGGGDDDLQEWALVPAE